MKKITKIEKIGVLLRRNTININTHFLQLFKALSDKFSLYLEAESLLMLDLNLLNQEIKSATFEQLCEEMDILLCLGGDGTLINALTKSRGRLPILGVNIGNLGFLTAINLSDISSFSLALQNNDFLIENRALLSAKLSNSGTRFLAINEVLIAKKGILGTIKIDVMINDVTFNTYLADGLIISTPTGSTAYNISAGGSVVYPHCKNMLITPVAPHSLTQRPLVLPDDVVLSFKVRDNANIIIDGQNVIDIGPKDRLNIRYSSIKALLIQKSDYSYFETLKTKFKWGENDK